MIVVVGLSHRTAPIALREALAFERASLDRTLQSLRAKTGLDEVMILSTCNRVELYAREKGDDVAARLAGFLAESHSVALPEIEPSLYRLSGGDAVRHAFRVAASLESMVLGESQILGQVKEAYQVAEQAGTLGVVLGTLRNRTLGAAKRTRSETAIGRNAVSISHVAVELARKIFGDLKEKQVLLVGAGKMSEIAARNLVRDGARATVVGGRSMGRATALAEALGGQAVPIETLPQELVRADIVISSTAAPCFIISRADVASACQARRHRPLFLIDIAVPRDIEPSVSELDGVFLYDIDDLKAVAEANLRERQREARDVEAIVEAEIHAFLDWQRSLDAVPLLVELRQRADGVRRAEIEKARGRLGSLSPEQEQAIEALTTGIVNKLLHAPTVRLKELAQNGRAPEDIALVKKILGL
jgi:glutamyl-tRNA reductase